MKDFAEALITAAVDQIVLLLIARVLTAGEIAVHFDEVYGAKVFKGMISRITEKVIEGARRLGWPGCWMCSIRWSSSMRSW